MSKTIDELNKFNKRCKEEYIKKVERHKNIKKNYILKQKVKDKIEEVHNMKFEDERLNSATIDFAVHKFKELLEEK